MDSYITWPYQIADHSCRITWVYNKMSFFHKGSWQAQENFSFEQTVFKKYLSVYYY